MLSQVTVKLNKNITFKKPRATLKRAMSHHEPL